MGAAECFGAIAYQHQWLGADVGDLVVVLGAEKYDLVLSDDALFAFTP
jgi:hypothetical protein